MISIHIYSNFRIWNGDCERENVLNNKYFDVVLGQVVDTLLFLLVRIYFPLLVHKFLDYSCGTGDGWLVARICVSRGLVSRLAAIKTFMWDTGWLEGAFYYIYIGTYFRIYNICVWLYILESKVHLMRVHSISSHHVYICKTK